MLLLFPPLVRHKEKLTGAPPERVDVAEAVFKRHQLSFRRVSPLLLSSSVSAVVIAQCNEVPLWSSSVVCFDRIGYWRPLRGFSTERALALELKETFVLS